jgi:hypothetical protein
MPIIDDAAILNLAKQLCEVDHIAWDHPMLAARREARTKAVLDDAGRREYLSRARTRLISESGNLAG